MSQSSQNLRAVIRNLGARRIAPRRLAAALATGSLLTLAVWPGMEQAQAQTLPSGLNVVQGRALVNTVGNNMTVTNSNGAILNWNSFSIGAQNAVRFEQANASSQVLNRVLGNDPSNILGQLSSNGKVWLLNPNGVLFGQGARINVAGLVTSTLNLSDRDWTAGRYNFQALGGSSAEIVNQGELRTTLGGHVALVGGSVKNEGLIEAPGGQILLAAGQSVELIDTGSPNLSVKVTAPQGQALNLGTLAAAGGRIDIHGAIVNQQGIVRADSLQGSGGDIVLKASQTLMLSADSRTTADGGDGGKGGQIQLLGRQVGLTDRALVSASGAAGGGQVLVGGGQEGKDASVPNSEAVYIGPEAHIEADATEQGYGGRVIVWSDKSTRAYGSFSARGGPQGGDGGFIETSGGWLDARPTAIDTGAPKGKAGQWLIDPYNIYISDTGYGYGTERIAAGTFFDPSGDDSVLLSGDINDALNAGQTVVIKTSTGGSQQGNIELRNANIAHSSGPSGGSLTLLADGNIDMIDSSISGLNGALNVSFVAGQGGLPSGGTVYFGGASTIVSGGGNIDIGGGGTGQLAGGGTFSNAAVNTQGFGAGITLESGTVLDAGVGNLALRGASDMEGSGNGISLQGSGMGQQRQPLLIGRNITLLGSAGISGAGVVLGPGSSLEATQSINVSGWSLNGVGVQMDPGTGRGARLLVDPGTPVTDPSYLLRVRGAGTDGVVIATETTSLVAAHGANILVDATGGVDTGSLRINGDLTSEVINSTGGGSVTLIGPSLALGHTRVVTDGDVLVQATRGLGGLTMTNSRIQAGGAIDVQANGQSYGFGSSLSSTAGGLAVGLSGMNGGALTHFDNQADALLDTPNGNWLIYASDPQLNWSPNGLNHDYTKHGSSGFADISGGPDIDNLGKNGFLFSTAQTALIEGDVETRAYDGTTSATVLGGTRVFTLLGDVATGLATAPLPVYLNKDAGVDKALDVGALMDTGFVDSGGKPVYGYTVQNTLKGTVTKKYLNFALVANDKVYDATTLATGMLLEPAVGLVGDETINIVVAGHFLDKNVGTEKTVIFDAIQLQDGSNGGKADNYTFSIPEGGVSAAITRADLQVTGLTAVNKTYDRSTAATLSGDPTVNALGEDSVFVFFQNNSELAGGKGNGPQGGITPLATFEGVASFSDRNAGTAKPVSVFSLLLGGEDSNNYNLIAPTLTANIAPLVLNAGNLSAANKVYDGGTSVSISGGSGITPLQGDSVSLSFGSGSFTDKNVGTNKTVVLDGFGLSGPDAGNYTVSFSGNLSADITPASIAVSGLTANNKVYDATTVATLASAGQVNAIGNDVVTLNAGSANFVDKNVGTAKTVVLSGFGLGGADAGNYVLQPIGNLSANITPATLAISGVTANNKVYDAGTAATLAGSAAVKALGSDVVTVGGTAVASFSDKNAGTGKSVSVSGFTLSGADAGNYTATQPTGLSANITPATLVIAGLGVADKVYDASTVAALTGGANVSALGSDIVSVDAANANARFADKNVGASKSVIVGNFSLSGTDAGNYTLQAPSNLTASITPASLSVNGISANNKVYDASSAASLSGSATVQGLGSDAVSVGGTAVASFANKNVGTGKSVSVTGYTLSGADAGNYTLNPPADLRADITPASLTISGISANNKVYDATLVASLSGNAIVQALANDNVSVGGTASASFGDKNVGSAKQVTVSGYTLTGADAGNYQVVAPSLTASITPASLQYLASPVSKAIGDAVPALSGSVTGFVGGETQQTATNGTLNFSSEVEVQTAAGSYAILGAGLSAQNYSFVQAQGNATAFTVTGISPTATLNQGTTVATNSVLNPLRAPTNNGLGGLLNMLQAPAAGAEVAAGAAVLSTLGGNAGGTPSFAGVRLGDMSQDALANMLASRDRYKKSLFADAIYKLEQDAALADLRLCKSAKDVAAGDCILTAELKQQIQAAMQAEQRAEQQQQATQAAPAPGKTAAPLPEPKGLTVNLGHKRKVKAAALPQIERKVAVVIGIDNYQDKSIPQLGNAVKDAQTVGSLFDGVLGYETVVIPNATKQAVVSALNKLALELGPKDSVVIYYAGHGELVESTGLGYWQLADADAKKPETWLSNADIGRMIAQIGASQVALISDSCYSGSLVSDERIRATPGGADPQAVLARKSVVVMSSGGNEPVFDEGKNGHSPFAWNLMNQLKQVSSWQAGGNVFERVRFAVAKELPQRPKYGSSSAAGHQAGGDYLFEQRQLESSN
ncbi:MAG: filamentous hemagglutinin N-terminal domain-containing protein [Burkholderiaceae bacterium]|nr:filamentous hemagglutinin N-terminal domain-containing protein [Burkholderiaceae bacterium]